MKLRLLAIGRDRSGLFAPAAEEYLGRLSRTLKLELTELPEARKHAGTPQAKEEEGATLLAKVKPGERLVAFLSDGAFEEQRGSDWAPRWWRAEDSGHVAPIMILNGRRIEQRSTLQQQGGVQWLKDHLRLNGFDPMEIDGTDPAAFAWAIFTMEDRLDACTEAIRTGAGGYPVPLHYTIAVAPKGYGFPGAGSNDAHNLPLGANPRVDAEARALFEEGSKALWVSREDLTSAAAVLNRHDEQRRVRERDHALATRNVPVPSLPALASLAPGERECSPMEGIDQAFTALVAANAQLRVRVGNPDELRSNRMGQTLDLLKHRVFTPEPGLAEAVDGAVITALNEEAVVSAALGNKGGINLVVSYEAFAVKMLGALRQEILFARHQAQAGTPPGWVSVVTVATSHTWENGKNEQSHQDPTLAEALLGEMSDTSRVLFPVDANSAVAALRAAYASHGQFWTLVVPKRAVASQLSAEQAERLVDQGGWVVKPCDAPDVLLVAIGAYQLQQALLAARRLEAAGHRTAVTCVIEPGRFRAPRDEREQDFVAGDQALRVLFPETAAVRVIVSHMRAEPTLGLMRRIDTGARQTRALGYQARGGTLDVAGMLFANRCTWAHVAAEAAQGLGVDPQSLLSAEEWAAVQGRGDPRVITVSA